MLKEIEKLLGIKDGETTRDGLFSLEVLSCIGACGQAPVMCINGKYYDKVTKKSLKEILNSYQHV
jgi:NADH:ubiquinone oxidoreductase subunit E